MAGQLHTPVTAAPRRSDAGIVRFGQRDITGLIFVRRALRRTL